MFRLNRVVLGSLVHIRTQSTRTGAAASATASKRLPLAAVAAIGSAAAVGVVALGTDSLVFASSDVLPPPHYSWSHKGRLSSFDHAAIRRGFQGK